MITKSNQKKPCSGVSTMPGLSRWPDTGASCRRKEFRQDSSMALEGSKRVGNSYIRRRTRLVHMQYTCTTHTHHKDQRKLADTSMPELPPMGMSSVFLTRCCLIVLILTAALTTACCLTLEQSNSSGTQSIMTVKGLDGGQGNVSQQASTDGSSRSSYQINGQQQFKNQSIKQSEQEVANPSLGANEPINNDKSTSTPLITLPSPRVNILDSKVATEVVTNQLEPSARKNNQRQLVAGKFGSDNQLDTSASAVGGNDDKLQPQSTQLVSSTTTELSPFLGSDSGQDEVMLAADSKKKKKMMKKKKKMEKKHKEWKKGKKHKKKKYESKKKKGGMEKKKKGKKEKKKWGMEKKGHKKKGNFKKKKWGHKKKMKKGHKKGKKGHKMLKDKGHKKKGFKKVYHKEEWGKKKKWHDIKREKKWNTKQKKWKKKWHQEKGKKYKGKHMKKYHKKNKHGKKYKKEKKSKWKKHKGEKYKKGHKKKKEEYSKKKEGGKKKKMKKMKKEMKKKKG